jgi:hypothetical protein
LGLMRDTLNLESTTSSAIKPTNIVSTFAFSSYHVVVNGANTSSNMNFSLSLYILFAPSKPPSCDSYSEFIKVG